MSLEIVAGAIECDNCHPSKFSAIKHDGVIRCSSCGVPATVGHGAIWTKKKSATYGVIAGALVFLTIGYFNEPIKSILPSTSSFFEMFFMLFSLYLLTPTVAGFLIGRFIAEKLAKSANVLSCKRN